MKEPAFNPFDRSTRPSAVASIVRMAILGALKQQRGGMVGSAIVSAVGCRRSVVFAALRLMWESGEIAARPRPGKGGGVIWELA